MGNDYSTYISIGSEAISERLNASFKTFFHWSSHNAESDLMDDITEDKKEILLSSRIAVHPDICHGKPRIKGTRIFISIILVHHQINYAG